MVTLYNAIGDEVREFTAEEYAQAEIDRVAAEAKVLADAVPPTPEEKLFSATGLTVAEYKALGL